MTNRNGRNNIPHTRLPFGVCLGMLFGIAVGMLTHNIVLWLSAGTTLGVFLGIVYDSRNKPHNDGDEDDI
ncbi:hypothetical protein CS006_06290 [Bifidobacterium primatium]|uniref:Glycine zipper-like domain-containing protein n=1 Tax=Bifidobacterium primatium TaxID=2045438 RepID=A0A2M9H7T0_9BIFI|nr:hypothetical protein [Bifidobacterium primatium]PJM72865.1 hypothetical protein CS006_06290 [Bifidobacterium primatium]